MNPFFTNVLVLVILMALYSIISFLLKLKRLKREKEQGLWDFIDEEYIDYLSSSEGELNVLKNIEIKYKASMDVYKLKGDLYYNNAGVFIKLHTMLADGPIQDSFFIFGSEKPSNFSPRSHSFFISIELYESTLILVLRNDIDRKKSNFKVELIEISHSIYSKISAILESVRVE